MYLIRYRGRQSILVSEDTFSCLDTDFSIKRGGGSLVLWTQLAKQ
jgi:hypothetical protein